MKNGINNLPYCDDDQTLSLMIDWENPSMGKMQISRKYQSIANNHKSMKDYPSLHFNVHDCYNRLYDYYTKFFKTT